MKYNAVKVLLKNEAGLKIERVFYVDFKISAEEFAIGVLSTFNVAFEHMFLFRPSNNRIWLVDDIWMQEDPGDNWIAYQNLTLAGVISLLGRRFILEYDTGDGYVFEVSVMKRQKEYLEADKIILVSGEGYGIFEDAHQELERFLNGENFQLIMNEAVYGSNYYDEREDIGTPYMCKLPITATLDDYFAPLDIDELNKQIKDDSNMMFDSEESLDM